MSPQNTPPHTPPFADTSNVLRKSSRIESGTKRSYNGMQSRQNGGGRPPKKFKYTYQEILGMSFDPLDIAARRESITQAAERSINDTTTVDSVRDTTDEPPNNDLAANAPPEAIQEPVDKTASTAPSTDSSLFGNPPRDNPIVETTTGTTTLSADNAKRSILDGSGNSLEIVLEALKTQNTDRIANSTVPGTCTVLTHTDPTVSASQIHPPP